jgi:cytochrome b subunit of formate dehydrogenase
LAFFILIHVSIALAVKGTIESMFTGRLAQKPPKKNGAPK